MVSGFHNFTGKKFDKLVLNYVLKFSSNYMHTTAQEYEF